nr:hypothetical protein [uncultured Allomuricauda sp.]
MNLSFNRYVAQQRCETFVACQDDLPKWQSSKREFENLSLNPVQSIIYSNDLRVDSVSLYKKGIHSLFNAIKSVDEKKISYSWASVLLYYSLHYFLRASLAAKGIGMIRNGGLYFLKDTVGARPEKKRGRNYNTTHGGAIYYSIDKYSNSDLLLSNEIDGLQSYVWMKEIREIINYRQSQFDEPTVPEIWKEIDLKINDSSLCELVKNYIEDDDFLFCFQQDHAILALPIKKAFLTKQELEACGIKIDLSDDEIMYFQDRITNDTSGTKKTKLELLIN